MAKKTVQELTELLKKAGDGNLIPERLITATIEQLRQLQTEFDDANKKIGMVKKV